MDNIEAEVNEPPADHGDPQLCIVSSDPGMEGFRITREQLSSLRLKYQQNAEWRRKLRDVQAACTARRVRLGQLSHPAMVRDVARLRAGRIHPTPSF